MLIDSTIFLVFAPTFLLISLMPGISMMFALSFGASVGMRRALWVILGQTLGFSLVSAVCLLGYSLLARSNPLVLTMFHLTGALYLIYAGINGLWQSFRLERPRCGLGSRRGLLARGLLVSLANPKAWIFLLALLPPFAEKLGGGLINQLSLLLVVVTIEFASLLLYAYGGNRAYEALSKAGRAQWLGRLSSLLLLTLGLWFLLG
ncbi:LysE family translocator [Shewanella cyperi]|uniref:LysE family translocator n=1 Tax=Shewanella cyperi TaxID=2814292 RepID=A0A974XMD3_9GAMM|nr:LysE family translocator [Shewanella cyperi]QSX31039.1 LysE family translocator [Shewanella cyperi]